VAHSFIDPLIHSARHCGAAFSPKKRPLFPRPLLGGRSRSWVSVIPGSTIILALSALGPGGELQLTWVLAAAIAGAMLGDGSPILDRASRPARILTPGRCRIIRACSHKAKRSLIAGRAGVSSTLRPPVLAILSDHGGCAGHAADFRFTASTSRRSFAMGNPACGSGGFCDIRPHQMLGFRIRPGAHLGAQQIKNTTGC